MTITKRYLVFAHDMYDGCCGGWDDFQGSFSTLDEAKVFLGSLNYKFKEIVDLQTEKVVNE